MGAKQSGNPWGANWNSVADNYTLPATMTHCACSVAGKALTLPLAADVEAGHRVVIKDTSGGLGWTGPYLTVQVQGSDVIGNGTTALLNFDYEVVEFESDGVSRWFIVGPQ